MLAAMAAVAVAAVDPFGWDSSGPIRWFVIPALGFLATSTRPAALTNWSDHTTRLWAVLVGWLAVASAFSPDPLHAWLGTPDRRFGWFVWLLCAALTLVGAALLEAERAMVARGVAAGSALLGLYTGAELLGLPTAAGDFAGGRLGGPLAQPAFLGAAAALTLPVSAGVVAASDQPMLWRRIGAVGAVGSLLAVVGSQSRAAWVGVVVSVGLWLVVARRSGGRATGSAVDLRWVASVAAPVAAAVALVPPLRSRVTGAFGSGGVVDGRLDEWRVGLRALADAPLAGYGPEGYRTVFGANVSEDYVVQWGRDVITDRAHAGWLDVALVGGVPALVLYVALLVLVGRAALRLMGSDDPTMIGVSVGVGAYAVQQQFLFPLSELDPLFWLLAGITIGATRKTSDAAGSDRSTGNEPDDRSNRAALIRGLAVGSALLVGAAGLADLVANQRLAAALDSGSGDQSVNQALGTIDQAQRLRPDSIRYRFVAARVAAGADSTGPVDSGSAGVGLDAAIGHIDHAMRRSPLDPAVRGERARLLLERARMTTAEPDRSQRLEGAETALREVLVDDPLHPAHLQRLGIALALQGDLTGARTALEQAVSLAPDDPEPAFNLAEVERLETGQD